MHVLPRFLLSLVFIVSPFLTYAQQQQQFDVVIVGGTPGGITTAIAAAREGRSVVLLERTAHIGGLPANGLGATDIKTTGATTGLFKEFSNAVLAHYRDTYGANSQQVTDCQNGIHFEPGVTELVFEQMLAAHADKITVLKMRQFDCAPENIVVSGGAVQSIKVKNRTTGDTAVFTGKIFVDATYEGDLAAAAGVPFRIGREAKSEFNEARAGVLFEAYKSGPEHPLSTHEGDDRVQAYNYRLCLTNNADNRLVPATPPPNYNREEYAPIIEDILNGNLAITSNAGVSQAKRDQHRANMLAGGNGKVGSEGGTAEGSGSTIIPGFYFDIRVIVNNVILPNGKRDSNNQHQAFLSTDLPEENYPWPTADWEWRDAYAERLKNYTLGLLYFIQNDSEVPPRLREACRLFGFAKDEYTDNGNFPRQVYVREGRRFEGQYFFTANDALKGSAARPPIHATSVTASHYHLDSHAVRKRFPAPEGYAPFPHLDGFFSQENQPYTVPYGVMLPDRATANLTNLLFPVPVSGSHVGFSTLRMEPCWMALGQAAGTAAAIAIRSHCSVQDVSVAKLQRKLANAGATLIYFSDVPMSDPDFAVVQWAGVRGFFSGTSAGLNDPLPDSGRNKWLTLTDAPIPAGTTKRIALQQIYAHENANPLKNAENIQTPLSLENGTGAITFFREFAEVDYTVEASSDLQNWTPIATNPGTVGESVTVEDIVSNADRRFLRLRLEWEE